MFNLWIANYFPKFNGANSHLEFEDAVFHVLHPARGLSRQVHLVSDRKVLSLAWDTPHLDCKIPEGTEQGFTMSTGAGACG